MNFRSVVVDHINVYMLSFRFRSFIRKNTNSEGVDITIYFSLDLDPTTRTTFWGIVIGLGTTWVANMGVNPSSVQRFVAVPSITAAKRYVLKITSGAKVSKVEFQISLHFWFRCSNHQSS